MSRRTPRDRSKKSRFHHNVVSVNFQTQIGPGENKQSFQLGVETKSPSQSLSVDSPHVPLKYNMKNHFLTHPKQLPHYSRDSSPPNNVIILGRPPLRKKKSNYSSVSEISNNPIQTSTSSKDSSSPSTPTEDNTSVYSFTSSSGSDTVGEEPPKPTKKKSKRKSSRGKRSLKKDGRFTPPPSRPQLTSSVSKGCGQYCSSNKLDSESVVPSWTRSVISSGNVDTAREPYSMPDRHCPSFRRCEVRRFPGNTDLSSSVTLQSSRVTCGSTKSCRCPEPLNLRWKLVIHVLKIKLDGDIRRFTFYRANNFWSDHCLFDLMKEIGSTFGDSFLKKSIMWRVDKKKYGEFYDRIRLLPNHFQLGTLVHCIGQRLDVILDYTHSDNLEPIPNSHLMDYNAAVVFWPNMP